MTTYGYRKFCHPCPDCGAQIEEVIRREPFEPAKVYWQIPSKCLRPPCAFVTKIQRRYVMLDHMGEPIARNRDRGLGGIAMTELNSNNPPSAHALAVLRNLPMPRQEMNFTVAGKLLQFGLATSEWRKSHYKTHKDGRLIEWLVASEIEADWKQVKPVDSAKILQPVIDRTIEILHSNGISSDVSAKQNKPSSV